QNTGQNMLQITGVQAIQNILSTLTNFDCFVEGAHLNYSNQNITKCFIWRNRMSAQFDHVSVLKKSNVHFGGLCISHIVQFEEGTKETLGVILPLENGLTFETHVPGRMEIVSGECRVQNGHNQESEPVRAGQSFHVGGNSRFKIET